MSICQKSYAHSGGFFAGSTSGSVASAASTTMTSSSSSATAAKPARPKWLHCVNCKSPFGNAWDLMVHVQTAHMLNIYQLADTTKLQNVSIACKVFTIFKVTRSL